MKKKTGFTLAEVLITLAIIGIIAALVLPALLNNFQFRAVGVRLSKFMSTVENTSRAFVESEEALNPATVADGGNLDDFINRSFSVNTFLRDGVASGTHTIYQMPADHYIGGDLSDFEDRIAGDDPQVMLVGNERNDGLAGNRTAPLILKDGTRVDFYAIDTNNDLWPNGAPVPGADAVGRPTLGIVFDPAANALPAERRRIFGFVVTSLGYVFPAPTDGCTWQLFTNRWQTRPENFADDTECRDAHTLGNPAVAWGNA